MENNEADLVENVNEGDVRVRTKISRLLARMARAAEIRFLSLLRFSMLIIASLALVVSGGLLIYGATQQLGRMKTEPENVSIASADVVPAKMQPDGAPSGNPLPKPSVSSEVRLKTLSTYRSSFQAFERPGSKIEPQSIVDLIWPQERIVTFGNLGNDHLVNSKGTVLKDGSAVSLDGLSVVAAATKEPSFQGQLIAYRDAKKVQVCTEKITSHSREVSYWDSFSTSCSNWETSPIGCASTRTVTEPSIENVCEMKFPGNLESPAQSFANAMQRYADVADAKLTKARIDADEKTAQNNARKSDGQMKMFSSGEIFAGFLAIMFLYLFIALERHHRSLRDLIAQARRY